MKKSFILCLLSGIALLSIQRTHAQEPHTFYMGGGLGTHEEFGDFFDGISKYMGSLGSYKLFNDTYSGAYFAGYRYALNDKLEVGGLVLYENMKGTMRIMDNSFKVRNDYYAFMGEVRYNFIVKPKFKLFSGAATGLSVHSVEIKEILGKRENELEEAFHIDLIGISVGRRIAPYIALGYGYKGVINFGLQTSFPEGMDYEQYNVITNFGKILE